jgi:hypothetical protein
VDSPWFINNLPQSEDRSKEKEGQFERKWESVGQDHKCDTVHTTRPDLIKGEKERRRQKNAHRYLTFLSSIKGSLPPLTDGHV